MGSKVDAVDRVRLKDIETEQIVCLCSFYSWARETDQQDGACLVSIKLLQVSVCVKYAERKNSS